MDLNKPEPAPKGTGREVTPLVVKDLEMRSKLGAEKYGETLRAFNGRNPLVDAYQEALDLVQYLRQTLEEQYQNVVKEHYDTELMSFGCLPPGTKLPPMSQTDVAPLKVDHLYTRPGRVIPVSGPGESVTQEAYRIVRGDRGEAYGHPIFDMTRTADMVTALLRHLLRPGAQLEAEDIGQIMIAVKQSRHQNKPKRDNEVDIAGYAECLEMIAEWRRENPGVNPRDVFPE